MADYTPNSPLTAARILRIGIILLLLTAAGILIHGYHYGIEDSAIYLPAIKQDLNPALYPHDSVFFRPQTNATMIGPLVAGSVRLLHVRVATAVFGWHVASLFLFLLGCWLVAARVFPTEKARFGAVAMITALLTISIAGTALYIADQYLQPRTLATACVLFAMFTVLPRHEVQSVSIWRMVLAAVWLVLAASVHIMMAAYGALMIVFLLMPWERGRRGELHYALLLIPFRSFFEKASPDWAEAARTRTQHYVLRWEWYEWLGIIAPAFLLWWLASVAHKKHLPLLRNLTKRTLYFTVFSLVAGLALILPPQFERLTPYQPLRTFHLVYIVMFLIIGGLLAEFILEKHIWRWLLLFVPLCAGMWYSQRVLFPDSPQVEWPGRSTGNAWVQAFDWVKANTPQDAYFVMDPHYIILPGEDYHGFRGLAERSQMADWEKDPGMVSLFPDVATRWHDEVHAQDGWKNFQMSDFERLKTQFGVNWAILAKNGKPPVLQDCPYQNSAVYVCKIE